MARVEESASNRPAPSSEPGGEETGGNRPLPQSGPKKDEATAIECVYTVAEVAERLKVSTDTVINLFKHEKGVIDLGRPATNNRRAYRILRIPAVVLQRAIDRRRVR